MVVTKALLSPSLIITMQVGDSDNRYIKEGGYISFYSIHGPLATVKTLILIRRVQVESE